MVRQSTSIQSFISQEASAHLRFRRPTIEPSNLFSFLRRNTRTAPRPRSPTCALQVKPWQNSNRSYRLLLRSTRSLNKVSSPARPCPDPSDNPPQNCNRIFSRGRSSNRNSRRTSRCKRFGSATRSFSIQLTDAGIRRAGR
jgi:hypothetical protein